MNKIVRLGSLPLSSGNARGNVFCAINTELKEDGLRLSISGVVSPLPSGNCRGSCGQIIMEFKEYDYRGYYTLRDINLNPDWSFKMVKRFFDVWDKWHLNDLHAGCKHQEEKIESLYRSGELKRGESVYDKRQELGFAYCDICEYNYGSAWKFEPIPQDVLDFLQSLPDTDVTPAWV